MLKKFTSIFTTDLDLLFFVLYLWTIPFSWRKVLQVDIPPVYQGFNEYLDISIYIGDLFLVIAVTLFIINNYKYILSSLKNTMFHVEQIKTLSLVLLLVAFSFISAIWSIDPKLALFSSFKLLEGFLLLLYLFIRVIFSEYKNSICSTWNTIQEVSLFFFVSIFLESLLAVAQVMMGKSIGFSFLSESNISIQDKGIAKIIFFGEPVLRGYGTFLHPNILGAFLVVGFFIVFSAKKVRMFHVEHRLWSFWVIFVLLGIISTFSKTAIFTLILGLFLFTIEKTIDVPRGTFIEKMKYLFHVEHIKKITVLIFILSVILVSQSSYYLLQSAYERVEFFPLAYTEFTKYPFFGLGTGQFVPILAHMQLYEGWQLQPIHNLPILFVLEFGIIGTSLIFLIVNKLVRVPRGTFESSIFRILILIFFMSLFDHYFWDIESGRILLFLVIGIYIISQYLTNRKLII